MCLFSCGGSRDEEENIVIPARPVNPTIIRTTTTTVPVTTTRPVSSSNNNNVIVLKNLSPRASRTSQHSYTIEPQRSHSRSPRTSNQQIVKVDTTRTTQLSPPLTPLSFQTRPGPGPVQGGSPRASSSRVHFVDSEPARLATAMLRTTSTQNVPQHRRSTSQVVVINRTPSQRRAAGPRLSDSVLVHTGGTTYATAEVIAPGNNRSSFVEIVPRGSRTSQISGSMVEIETAGGRQSRRQSNVQLVTTDANNRVSGTWRPVRERVVVVDSRGNRTEYYR